jgi:hypothetical protein
MRRRAGGFTLLEILLALMLTGLVLVSLNTFIFSMGELWGRGGDARLLDRHVQAFTRFLEEDLRGAESGTVGVREMRTAPGGREWVVSYLRPEGNRVMVWPERPLPDVLAGLGLRDGQGLWLLWHSVWEERFLADPARETQLSPWVTAVAYDYFDEESRRWETRPDLRRLSASEYETPRRLRLTFAYRHLTRESVILLPAAPPGSPTF